MGNVLDMNQLMQHANVTQYQYPKTAEAMVRILDAFQASE